MDNFQYFRDANPPADILISVIRDASYPYREIFFEKMGIDPADPNIIEVPLAKITRRMDSYFTGLNQDLLMKKKLCLERKFMKFRKSNNSE